jgi:hypothetical protein
MTFLPSVIRAEYHGGFRIRLTFNDLSKGTVDFRPWLKGPVFEGLKDPAYFQKFFLDGGTIVWPNGADIAPETLYQAVASFARRRGNPPGQAAGKENRRQSKARARH